MRPDDRATVGVAVAVALLLALVGVGLVVGLQDDPAPTGEEVLNDSRDRYAAADSVVIEATVTVRNDSATEVYDVTYVATDDDRARVTLDDGNRTVVAGTNGSAKWVLDPGTGVAGVYDDGTLRTVGPTGEVRTYDLRNGSAPNASAVHGNGSAWGNGTGHHGNDSAWHHDAAWNASDGHWNVTDPAEGHDWNRSNASVERVETTEYEGARTHVVEITPENESADGRLRTWIRANDSVVVRHELTTPNGTVTVDVHETRFNVSVADSTFEPPTADGAAAAVQPVDTVDELAAEAPFRVAVLGDDAYAFEGGAVTRLGAANATTAVSRYAGDEGNVTLVQTDAEDLPVETDDATTATAGDRTVNVTETDGRVVVFWAAGDTTVAVVGDGPRDRLLDVAASVELREESTDG